MEMIIASKDDCLYLDLLQLKHSLRYHCIGTPVSKNVTPFNHWLQLRLQPLLPIFYEQRSHRGVVGAFCCQKNPLVNAAWSTTSVCSGL